MSRSCLRCLQSNTEHKTSVFVRTATTRTTTTTTAATTTSTKAAADDQTHIVRIKNWGIYLPAAKVDKLEQIGPHGETFCGAKTFGLMALFQLDNGAVASVQITPCCPRFESQLWRITLGVRVSLACLVCSLVAIRFARCFECQGFESHVNARWRVNNVALYWMEKCYKY